MAETCDYRHKKFDQCKRARTDSLSSSSAGGYESLEVKEEQIDARPFSRNEFGKSSVFNWSAVESNIKRSLSPNNQEECIIVLPESKRPRLGSFTPTIRHQATTALTNAVVQPAAAVLPKISEETLRNICKYHGNMVRKFPKKERTPKDQERRNKNTIACRMSRRVKKLEHIAIEEQYKEFSQQTFDIIEQSMRATAYLQELMKLTSCKQAEELQIPSSKMLNDKTPTSSPSAQKKPFTIAFLTGAE